jgi:hypothetical protein
MALESISKALGDGNAENERNFARTFLRTQDYESAETNLRNLILGGRGTGKSAICRMLGDSTRPEGRSPVSSDTWTVSLAFDDVTRVKLEKEAVAARYDIPAISRQWELALLLQCFELAMERASVSIRQRKLVRDLDREIVKLLNREDMRIVNEGRLGAMVEAAVKMLRQLPFNFKFTMGFPVPVSIEVQKVQDQKEGRPTPDPDMDKARLIQGMYGVLDKVLPDNARIRILIDELDVAWKARQEQISSLAGLLSAVMRMRGPLVALHLEEKVNVAVFLRADIYEILKQRGLDDASKYTRHELHLRWDPITLRSMLDRRIGAAGIPGMRTMRDLFANAKISRRSLDDYLLTWITPRPRDLITIMQECLEAAGSNALISRADVQKAMINYSSWRETVILEETRYGLDKAGDLLNSFKNGSSEYTPKELRSHLDQVKREYAIQTPKPRLIEILVNAGFLGVISKVKGASAVFLWDVPARQSLGPHEEKDDEASERWIVHPALWGAFDIRPRPRAEQAAKG